VNQLYIYILLGSYDSIAFKAYIIPEGISREKKNIMVFSISPKDYNYMGSFENKTLIGSM